MEDRPGKLVVISGPSGVGKTTLLTATALALADELRADSRLASVALRNANDGVSIASVADGALQEIGTILERMAELASQSANGTYTNTHRRDCK
jgi:flagellin